MGYIIVLPEGFLTSEVRAQSITRELYNITVPLAVQQEYQKDGTVFGVVTHPDGIQHALQVDLDYVIPVHPDTDMSTYYGLFEEFTEAEKAAIDSMIATRRVAKEAERQAALEAAQAEAGDDFNPDSFYYLMNIQVTFDEILPASVTVTLGDSMTGWFPE